MVTELELHIIVTLLLIVYVIISILIGVLDVVSIYARDTDLNHTPTGDIGYYVIPKHITGVHNVIFLPSIVIILSCIGIAKFLDRS